MHAKADVIMLDLEDSVSADEKEAAREAVIDSLLALDFRAKRLDLRINSLDSPFAYGNFKDAGGLRKSSELARALGCDGKWVIHPGQIDTVNQVFTPSEEEIRRARQILSAAGARPRGAVAVDGRMVDLATIRIARRVWDQAVFLGQV